MDSAGWLTWLPVIPGPHRLETVLNIDQGLRRIILSAPTHAAWPRSSDCPWVQISSNWRSVVFSTGRPWAIPYKERASQIFVSLESLVHPVLVKNARSPEIRDWLCLEGKVLRCTARFPKVVFVSVGFLKFNYYLALSFKGFLSDDRKYFHRFPHQRLPGVGAGWQPDGLCLAEVGGVGGHCPGPPWRAEKLNLSRS